MGIPAKHFKHLAIGGKARTSKYRAIKTVVDGIEFHSKGEARRWSELRLMEKAGVITNLHRQYELVFRTENVSGFCGPHKDLFKLIVDFRYVRDGKPVYEDFKGVVTPIWRLKQKLIEAAYRIKIEISRKKQPKRMNLKPTGGNFKNVEGI